MAQKVREPKRAWKAAEILEQAHPVGQVPQSTRLLGGHPRRKEALRLSRIVDHRNHPIPGPRQRAGGVQNNLHHRFEIEALVDAQADLDQPGKTLPQGLDFPLKFLRRSQFASSWLLGIRPFNNPHHMNLILGPDLAFPSLDSGKINQGPNSH